jgi:hypothetical protein
MDEQALRQTLRAGPDCPPIEVLNTNLLLDAADSRRVVTEQHLLQCLHCRTELDLLQEFASGPIRPEEAADVEWIVGRLKQGRLTPDRPRLPVARWWRLQWATPRLPVSFTAAAAVALLAIIIIPQWERRRDAARPVPEFANEAQRARKIEVVETPGSFAWKPVVGAVNYELTVRAIDDTIIFHNTFTGSTLVFPPEVAAVEKTGKLLEWEVVARDPNGNDIAESGLQKLRRQ